MTTTHIRLDDDVIESDIVPLAMVLTHCSCGGGATAIRSSLPTARRVADKLHRAHRRARK